MKATEILKHEHQTILLVIAAVEKEVTSINNTGEIHAQTIREMADFLKNFVDRCHYVKEEKHLFVIICRRGMSMKTGPLALPVMIQEHEQSRGFVCAIAEAVADKSVHDAATIQKIKENMAAYAQLLRTHIDKENNFLYVMADRILDIHDQEALCSAFDKVNTEEMGEGVQEKYHSWIEKLINKDFPESSVRLSQTGAWESSTGIKDEPAEPIIAIADKALTEGFADAMINKISIHLAEAIKEKFHKALEAWKNKDKSVDAGREFVQAYLTYMHYVDDIHSSIISAGNHRHTEATECETEHKEHKE